MGNFWSPNILSNDLVFGFDLDSERYYKGKSTTNLFSGGDFRGGVTMSSESGSNPTNTIIQMKNPGNSTWVLRQNGNNTEYQINLTSQLVSNTTYVMSGWYAESSNYNGSSTMFHSRAFSSSGNHVALDIGLFNVIRTINVGGLTWKYCYATITTPSDYNNNFNWYLGYGTNNSTGFRYYTNIQMEVGTYPTQFANTTRSSTEGLIDMKRRWSLNLNNVSFTNEPLPVITFDGINDYIEIPASSDNILTTFSAESWFKANGTPTNGFHPIFQKEGGYSGGAVYGLRAVPSNTFYAMICYNALTTGQNTLYSTTTLTNGVWYHVATTFDSTNYNWKIYINGVLENSATLTANPFQNSSVISIGRGDARYTNGDIRNLRLYNKVLTPDEIWSNFISKRKKFGL
jgi:hypothetical protein